jgi:membrane associated rhomboid family serine protease
MLPLRDSQPSHSRPVITIALIVTNVLVFLFQVSLDPVTRNDFTYAFGFVPDRFHWFNVFTSMFMHGGWMHLITNMLFLWVFGDNVEDILGRAKYLAFYLLCGVGATVGQYLVNPESRLPLVGASGAIAGVMGAYLVKFPHSRIVALVPILFFFTTFEIPAWWMLAYWFVLQFFSGVGSIASSHASQGGVAFFAHIGGFVTGIILIKLLNPRPRFRYRSDLSW